MNGPFASLHVRPYELLCVICRLGQSRASRPGEERLDAILQAVRREPCLPLTLRCNVDTVCRYQNPGLDQDTPEGPLFNRKRDLDILQKLGLVPGDTRPANELFFRIFERIPTCMGICAYDGATSPLWAGCPQASQGGYEKGHALGLAAVIPPRPAAERQGAKEESVRRIYAAPRLFIRPHHLLCIACFHAGRQHPEPIEADNLAEIIEVVQKNPEIPITLRPGPCMVCMPCDCYDPATDQCVGRNGRSLRDDKRDLDTLQRLGLAYGDTLPARDLFRRVFQMIPSTRDVCAYGGGPQTGYEWSVCGDPKGAATYEAAARAGLGIPGLAPGIPAGETTP